MNSPWWYRGRTIVFAVIYFIGFFSGGMWSRVHYGGYVPALTDLGRALGSHGFAALAIIAVACAAIAYALRVWGSSYLRAGIVWNPDARSDTLLVAGPFRFVRNPLYLGNTFLAIGVGLPAPVPGFVFIVIANVALVVALGRHEEIILERKYGERFREYAKQVPSLIPRLTPVPAQGSVHPSLAQGLLSEVFTASILVGIILAFADRQHGEIDFLVLYAGGIIAQRMIARAQRPS